MRFTGQIRVPEVDHPGVPVIFVVDDNQAEVILEGESLGRWSLFDVHVTRLVSSAFQVELAGEEITFLADEPVDFAYKGVEHMAEAWARYKTMTVPRRVVAVKRSRRGTTPSRIQEFHSAMVENLKTEGIDGSGATESSMLPGESVATPVSSPQVDSLLAPATEPSEVIDSADAVMPSVAGSDELDQASAKSELEAAKNAETERAEAALIESNRRDEADRMAAEREALVAERALLEEQKRSLEDSLAQAELLEKKRLEAAQIDIERIESEKQALEERHEQERLKAERLETERRELRQLEADRAERELQQAEDFALRQQEFEELEAKKHAESESLERERQELVRLEAERIENARIEMEKLEKDRAELVLADEKQRLETERLQLEKAEAEKVLADEKERLETERLQLEKAEGEKVLADEKQRLETVRLQLEKAEAERVLADEEQGVADEEREAKRLEKEKEAASAAAAATVEDDSEDHPSGRVAEVLGTSVAGDLPENAKELVVDLGAFEEVTPVESTQDRTESEPALAGVPDKSGIMGAVKAAFTRNGKNHVHEFTEAPGGLGMVRYICRECGYVSISSAD